jgi:phospholipase/lecithinase/hemolysin
MRAPVSLVTSCLVVLPFFAAAAAPLGVTNLVVFGDSLSDNGNAYIATSGAQPGANYATGMFTDGTNTTPSTNGPLGLWSDQLSHKLGLADPAPFLSGAPGATDFAVGSAQTGYNGLYFVGDQVNAYLATAPRNTASSKSLYTFWAGANDVAAFTNAKTAADNIALNILTLAAAGGKNFLWLDLPPLGQTPDALALDKTNPTTTPYLNGQSAAFNAEWQTDIYHLESLGINVIGVDVNSIFSKIAANYAAGCIPGAANPYCFANITSPAQGVAGADPNKYLFWDGTHPTTEADSLVAGLAQADLQAVPEPVSATLSLAGLALVAGSAVRARRRVR